MSDGFSIGLFYLVVLGIALFVKVTTSQERQSLMWWFFIGLVCLSSLGLAYEFATTGSILEPGGWQLPGPQG